MRKLQHIYLILAKISFVRSHYWPNGYNRASKDHTWSYTPLSSNNYFTSYQQPQPQYTTHRQVSIARPFSVSRNSFYSSKQNKWPVKGREKIS